MSKLPIAQMISEAEQWQRQAQTDAAKPGKGQGLAQHRAEMATGIVTLLKWSRDNAEELRAYRNKKGQAE